MREKTDPATTTSETLRYSSERGDFPPELMDILLREGSIRTHQARDVIMLEQDSCEMLVFVIYGRVRLMQTLDNGKELLVYEAPAGDCIGESALLDSECYPYTAIAMEDTTLLTLSMKRARGLLECHAFSSYLLQVAFAHQRMLGVRLRELGGSSAERRIAEFILRRCEEDELPPDGHLRLPMTHREIASMLGIRTETSVRIFSKWRKKAILHRRQREIVVDLPALRQAVSL